MSAMFSLRLGGIEVQCSGTEEFLNTQIPKLLEYVAANKDESASSGSKPEESAKTSTGQKQLTVNSIAAKIGGGSGTELILAACVRLTRDKHTPIRRSDILAELKKATQYYKQTYTSNLGSYLKTLVQNHKLLEQSVDTYALSDNTLTELEAKLA